MIKNFRTFNLAVEFYHETRGLCLPGYLREQLERAASSIALNLAEGSGRQSRKEQKRFYVIALGSLRESQAALLLLEEKNPTLDNLADNLGAHLYRLIQAVDRELS